MVRSQGVERLWRGRSEERKEVDERDIWHVPEDFPMVFACKETVKSTNKRAQDWRL